MNAVKLQVWGCLSLKILVGAQAMAGMSLLAACSPMPNAQEDPEQVAPAPEVAWYRKAAEPGDASAQYNL